MARNRVIYQSDALYASKNISSLSVSGAREHVELERIQSANYSFTINRQDINQFGELARIGSIVLEPPTVNLDFTYYLTDGSHEKALNFYVQNPANTAEKTFLSGHMASDFSGQNFYILTSAEGDDLNLNSGTIATQFSGIGYGVAGAGIKSIIGIGNTYVTNYTLDASVGNLPTVSVSFEAANASASTGIFYTTGSGFSGWNGIPLASVNPVAGTSNAGVQATSGNVTGNGGFLAGNVFLPVGRSNLNASGITALRPGDITLSLASFETDANGVFAKIDGVDGIHIQSASLAIPLARTPIQKLGSRFAFTRPLDLPASATLSVSAIVNEMTAENIANSMDTVYEKNITLTINKPGTTIPVVKYTLKNCRLDSESFTSSIGANKTVDLVFSTQYSSLNDTTKGVYMSGVASGEMFSSLPATSLMY